MAKEHENYESNIRHEVVHKQDDIATTTSWMKAKQKTVEENAKK